MNSAFDSAWAIVKMPMYYHATPSENLDPILREGIRSNWGEVYASKNPEIARRWVSFTRRDSPKISVIPFWRDEGDPRMQPGVDHSPMMLSLLGVSPEEAQDASWTSSEPIPPQDIWPDAVANERSEGVITYDNPFYDENYVKLMQQMLDEQKKTMNDGDGVEKSLIAGEDEWDQEYSLVPDTVSFAGDEAWKLMADGSDKAGGIRVELPRPSLDVQLENRFKYWQDRGLDPKTQIRGYSTGNQGLIDLLYTMFESEGMTNHPIPIIHADIDGMYQGQGLYSRGVLPALLQHYGTLGSHADSRSVQADRSHQLFQQSLPHPEMHTRLTNDLQPKEFREFINEPAIDDIVAEWDLDPIHRLPKLNQWLETANRRRGKHYLDRYDFGNQAEYERPMEQRIRVES